jgi:hypothetical protein
MVRQGTESLPARRGGVYGARIGRDVCRSVTNVLMGSSSADLAGELSCNRAWTTLRDPNADRPLHYYACPVGTGTRADRPFHPNSYPDRRAAPCEQQVWGRARPAVLWRHRHCHRVHF